MERDGLKLTEEATRLLNDIRQRWPEWRLRPPEQAGFHVWHSTGTTWIEGSAEKLENAPDDELVEIAKNLADNADFLDGNDWQALCLADPDRAFRGLSAAAKRDDWSIDFWRHFLWARKEYQSPDTEPFIAVLLLQWPKINFALVAGAASSWLNEHVATLDEALLWPLWDKIATASLTEISEPTDA
jgi:hypothetical protein